MSSGPLKFGHVSHRSCVTYPFCTIRPRLPAAPAMVPRVLLHERCSAANPLSFSHRATRSPVIPSKRYDQRLPQLCLPWCRAGWKPGSALPSSYERYGHDLASVMPTPWLSLLLLWFCQVDRERNPVQVKLYRRPTSFFARTFISRDRHPIGTSYLHPTL